MQQKRAEEDRKMFYVSNIKTAPPKEFSTPLQRKAYRALEELKIQYERVETDVAITMDDCVEINKKLNMDMVKTLFLYSRKQDQFYMFITVDRKHFNTKNFCNALGISRVSFASKEQFEEILGTEIGAATVFSTLTDSSRLIHVVIDRDIAETEYYGCSDGTTTGYMKIRTEDILKKLLPYADHDYWIIRA